MITRIIPEMSFTCSGTVTHWRAAGEFYQGNAAGRTQNSVLSIWREKSSEPGTYNRVGGIQLGICESEDPAPSVPGTLSGVYECTLPQNERVSVQPGDIVGIELPASNRADFQLYFDNTNNAPINHVFNGHGSTFSLSDAISFEQASDQPQIILTIEPDIVPTTTALPTTQPLPATTEALLTMTDPPTTPPLTSTSMATTEPPTSTKASTTMDAATEPPTSTEASTAMRATTNPSTPTTTEASTTTMIPKTQPSTTTGSPTTDTAATTSVNSESIAAGSTTTEIPPSTSTDAQAPREGEAVQRREINTGTIAGAAVGAIIAILLVLIIVLLLVLVLRRQNRNGQKFTPSNNATIVNPVYDGKPIVPNLEGVFH
jgi:hypothetical protein